MQIFVVYDAKARAYNQPFFFQTVEMCRRSFFDVVNDPATMFFKHSTDYTLFHIGTFDDETAIIESFAAHQSLGLASQFKSTERAS